MFIEFYLHIVEPNWMEEKERRKREFLARQLNIKFMKFIKIHTTTIFYLKFLKFENLLSKIKLKKKKKKKKKKKIHRKAPQSQ